MANSGAILQLPESYLDLVRPGILLYGVYPSAEVEKTIAVRPALSWKSRVVYFKVVTPGHPVGYGSTWQADHPVRVVTVPVGYGDGYFRALSNVAEVIIRGKRYPVVGRVSMDQIMVNIEWDTAYNGDPVVLLGRRRRRDRDVRAPRGVGGHDSLRGADEHQHARAARVRLVARRGILRRDPDEGDGKGFGDDRGPGADGRRPRSAGGAFRWRRWSARPPTDERRPT